MLAQEHQAYRDLTELAVIWNRHPATFTRWILKGVVSPQTGDRIKLEAVRTPGKWLVPDGAVERFFERVTAARTGAPATTATAQATATHEKHQARVAQELSAIGI